MDQLAAQRPVGDPRRLAETPYRSLRELVSESDDVDAIVHRILSRDNTDGYVAVAAFNSSI